MIRILDEIPLAADRIAPVLEALDRLYLPACAARGLALEQRWVSPPVAVPGQCNILWLLWQVADVPAYYAMRSATGAEARAFWDQVERIGALFNDVHQMKGAGTAPQIADLIQDELDLWRSIAGRDGSSPGDLSKLVPGLQP